MWVCKVYVLENIKSTVEENNKHTFTIKDFKSLNHFSFGINVVHDDETGEVGGVAVAW